MKTIKKRATLYALGLVLLLVAIFLATIIQDKKKVLNEKTTAHRALLRNSFELSILDTQKGLREFACQLATNREIVDAFASGDREKLYLLSLPYFKEAKRRGDVDVTGFVSANGSHFLRLQDPHKYGDNILKKRPMLAYAIQTKKPITSLDVTIYDVAIVNIIPIFKGNTFIGILQTVAKIDRVQQRLNAHSGIKSAIVFDTNKLSLVIPEAKKITYQGFSLVSSNDPLFSHLPSNYAFNTSNRYTIDGRNYIIASRSLTNYKDDTIAMMMCAFDITDDVIDYNKEIRNLIIISILLLTIIAFILHYGFKILVQRISRDADTARKLNLQLEHQLYTDNLTSLPNRNALIRDIQTNKFYALMLLNIDNFKEINDFYGHEMGDETLLSLSKSIKSALHNLPMNLYKMPSDEYAIALIEPMTLTKLETTRQSIVHHIQSKHYNLQGASIYVTFTMGMDISKKNNAKSLLANADMALKAAKKRHLSYTLYDETMQIKQEYQNNILWSKKVKEAIEQKCFTLHYQPIFDTQSGEVIEYEALIRIVDRDGSIISPAHFLPAAKQSRLYSHISQFVIDAIFNMLEKTPHRYSINLSVDDIFDAPTREFLIHKLSTTAHGNRLIFELLESEGIENYAEVSAFIAQVKQFGVQIAIDDFGTGYSNFAHILKLDVDILKIDGSLIRNLDTDTNTQTVVLAVTEFSKRLGIKIVAEFVHSEAVYNKCKEFGIDYLQGYYLGEPKPL
ncbi:MAG: EAL domain-containing protein [Sulfuricurvum sp.]|nr:EAL domain-containing protein [Sulfuricurvum sp.]